MTKDIPQPPYDSKRIYSVPIKAIYSDDEWNCRGFIDPTSIIELATDIKNRGLLSPVILMPNPDLATAKGKPLKLVAGYRRYRAHQMNAADSIDAIIKVDLDEISARVLNLTENLQRKDLDMKQEAHAIERLRFLPQDEIARRISKSRGWVQTRMYLLELPEEIQDEAAAGRMTSNEIRVCSQLGDPDAMFKYLLAIKEAKFKGNMREVDPAKLRPSNAKKLRSAAEIEEMQEIIREIYGNGIATKALAWAGGFITPYELHRFIEKDALERLGKYYQMPDGLEKET